MFIFKRSIIICSDWRCDYSKIQSKIGYQEQGEVQVEPAFFDGDYRAQVVLFMQCHSHHLRKYEAIPGTKTGKLAASGTVYFQVQHGLLYCISQSLRPPQGKNKPQYNVSSELFIV